MKPNRSLFVLLSGSLLASCILGPQAKRGSVVDNEAREGIIYDSKGRPAVNARVRVFSVAYLPDTLADTGKAPSGSFYSTRTNEKGSYQIGALPNGEYNILADLGGEYGMRDSVFLDTGTASVPSDTLDAPGSLAGVVRLQPNHDPRFAIVQVLGTYNYAKVEEDGRFRLPVLAGGTYTLRISTSLPDYQAISRSITIKPGKLDSLEDTLDLPYLGIPVVQGLAASFDTLHSIVKLSWRFAKYRDFAEYRVYRDADPVLALSTNAIGITQDTLYLDSLAKIPGNPFLGASASNPQSFEYRVRIRSKSDQDGLSYGNVRINTPPRSLVSTDIRLQLKTAKWDSARQADSVEVALGLSNPTRKLMKLTWSIGSAADTAGVDSLGGVLSAERTLRFGRAQEGAYHVYVRVEDDAGTIWADSLAIQGNSAPTISGIPDSTARPYADFRFVPVASDADRDTLRFGIVNAPKWAAFDSLTGALSGTPTNADTGTYSGITLSVSDGRRTRKIGPFSVRVPISPWMPGPSCPGVSYLPVAVTLAEKIYLLNDSVRVLDAAQKSWTTIASFPDGFPNRFFAVALAGKLLFTFLGGDSYAFDPTQRTWTPKAHFPGQDIIGGGAVVGGIFYTINRETLWTYDPIADTWVTKNSKLDPILSQYLDHARYAAVEGKLLITNQEVIGGQGDPGFFLSYAGMVGIYDPSTDSWAQAASITPRVRTGIGAIRNQVYITGGFEVQGYSLRVSNRVQVYDLGLGRLTEKTPMPIGLEETATTVFDGKLYLFTGNTQDKGTKETWVYDPSLDP